MAPRLAAAALALALAGPGAARERPAPAGDDAVTGVVALRAGAALPAGEARAGLPVGDLVRVAAPVGLELAARGGTTTFGVLVEYGPGLAGSCPAGARCAGAVTRAGVELLERRAAGPGGAAWIGAGVGWERTSATVAGRTTRVDSLELLNVQAGRDFAAGGGVLLGPFVAATLARGMTQDGVDLDRKRTHAWLQVGIRAELGR